MWDSADSMNAFSVGVLPGVSTSLLLIISFSPSSAKLIFLLVSGKVELTAQASYTHFRGDTEGTPASHPVNWGDPSSSRRAGRTWGDPQLCCYHLLTWQCLAFAPFPLPWERKVQFINLYIIVNGEFWYPNPFSPKTVTNNKFHGECEEHLRHSSAAALILVKDFSKTSKDVLGKTGTRFRNLKKEGTTPTTCEI